VGGYPVTPCRRRGVFLIQPSRQEWPRP
jgi:hypothetical protein